MKKILIVDDEIMVRVGMKALIDWEACGYTIIGECADGVQALKKIEQTVPDLVLTDLKMDKMDGFALIAACKERYPNIKFIILSNYNDFENTKKAIQMGAIDYIFKLTVTAEEMKKALENAKAHLHSAADNSDRFLRKNITGIKAYLIKMAAEGSYQDEFTMQQDLQRVSPGNDFAKPYCVLQISIDNQQQKFSKNSVKDLQLLKYGIENLLCEVMNEDVSAEVYGYFRENFLIVMNVDSASDFESLCGFVQEKFSVMREYVQRYFSFSITGALSRTVSGLQSLRIAVDETSRVLAYRLETENGMLHFMQDNQRPEIAAVKAYIQNHLTENLSLEIAAKEVNMSQSYFSHIFKTEMKISFVDYVNQLRIQRACLLLQNHKLKVNEIAAQVGIENYNYFSVLFKKVTGVSPVSYREQLQEMEKA